MLSGPPPALGGVHQPVGDVVEPALGENFLDLFLGQDVGEAVGAEQEHIAPLHRHAGELGVEAVVHAQRPGDDVLLGVMLGFLGGDGAAVHQLLHVGVVVGELGELTVPDGGRPGSRLRGR